MVYLDDAEFKRLVAERKAKQGESAQLAGGGAAR
jgi:hypothetical protein